MKKNGIYLTLGGRFVILASVTFLFPLVIFASFASRNYGEAVNLKLEQMTDAALGLIDKNIDYIIRDVESTASLITTNRSTQALLLEKDPERYKLEYREKELAVKNLLINVTNNKDFFETVYLGNQYTSVNKYRSSIASEAIESYEAMIENDWYRELTEQKGKGVWYKGDEIPGFTDNLLIYAKSILNMNNPRPIGILLVGIGESPFSQIFSDQQVDFNAKILISQNDQIIFEYSPSEDEFLSSLTQEQNRRLIRSDGIVDISKKVYVRHIENRFSGWQITSVVPYKEFQAERMGSSRLFFSIAAGCFLAGVLLMCFFSHGMTRTLKKLRNYVEALRQGDTGTEVTFSSRDEVGMVGNELVRVVSENHRLMQNLYQSMYKEKEAELMALQAQINPHFLYNTLDSIFWMAQEYHAQEIGEMVVALSNVFKLSLNKGEKFIELGKELDLVTNYLEIQKMRFGSALRTEIDVPEELKKVKILKFIIQPLVENSVLHGLAENGMAGTIRVTAKQDGACLNIAVEDDGQGFSGTFEKALQNGYALKNVEERIKLCYGEDCGIFMDPEVSAGCRILLRLKVWEEEQ
ncbi:sensor histidine kinase [bacterium 1XD42-54]|nr:sensor histidine kinase [bacterium 1XD42-54]